MSAIYETEHAVAIEAVRAAAMLCRSVRSEITPDSMAKADRSPVTVADFGSQAVICRALAEAFPSDPVIAEEDSAELRSDENAAMRDRVFGQVRALHPGVDAETVLSWIDHGGARNYTDRFWTLDPIDGTKGFLRGGQYAIALALLVGGKVVVAALACPNLSTTAGTDEPLGAIFSAVRGQGAWVQSLLNGSASSPIRVSDQDRPEQVRFCESVESGHSAHGEAAALAAHLGIVAPPLRMDSQAKYAVVGRGEAAAYLRLPTRADYREKIWDHAAGTLIVEESGGVVTDVDGRPLEFTHGSDLAANRGVIVTNGRLHGQVVEALRTLVGRSA
jgi:3'(2'), 5'-bisphosphate nucleotidase